MRHKDYGGPIKPGRVLDLILLICNWEPLQPLIKESVLSGQPKKGQLTQEGRGSLGEVMWATSPPASRLLNGLYRELVHLSKQSRILCCFDVVSPD
jgi:hypothetical protein